MSHYYSVKEIKRLLRQKLEGKAAKAKIDKLQGKKTRRNDGIISISGSSNLSSNNISKWHSTIDH